MKTWVSLRGTSDSTRVVVTRGGRPVLKASLPPLGALRHPRAVTTLLEALSLWADERLCVVLSAAPLGDSWRCGLTDEMGRGEVGVYYEVEVVQRAPRRRGGEPRVARQLTLAAPLGGAR
jgi:hypothetical protein